MRERRLFQPWRGVLVMPDRATDINTLCAAAILAVGDHAAITGGSAAALYGFDAAAEPGVEVAIPVDRNVRRRPGLTVRHVGFGQQDVEDIAGVRVLRLPLVLADLLRAREERHGLAVLEQVLASTPTGEHRALRERVARDLDLTHGQRPLATAFSLVTTASGLSESRWESWMKWTLIRAGLPTPTQQYEVLDLDGVPLYRLDLAWPELRVAAEYDGYAAHSGREERDRLRDLDLGRRGWIVVRADQRDISRPGELVSRVRAAFRRRGYHVSITPKRR